MKPKAQERLLIVAHPDDETLFFSGILQQKSANPWRVICVTDGNADGQGKLRHRQWIRALGYFGIKRYEHWTFPDRFEKRLDVPKLLKKVSELSPPAEIFTHNPLGEYGHPHHQDVSIAVHRVWHSRCPIWSPATNSEAQKRVVLTSEQYLKKCKIFSKVYFSETYRSFNLIPSNSIEGYSKIGLQECEALYSYFTGGKLPPLRSLQHYRWLLPYFIKKRDVLESRIF